MRCDECLFYSNALAVCKARPPRISPDFTSAVWPPMPAGGWCGAWKDDTDLTAWRRGLRYMLNIDEVGKVPANDREAFDRKVADLKRFIDERMAR